MKDIFTPKLVPSWRQHELFSAHIFVLFLLALWYMPFTGLLCQQVDRIIFSNLNFLLVDSDTQQVIWGLLSHRIESRLNLVLMVGINFLGIFFIPREQRLRAFCIVIYSWLFFQIAFFTTNIFFHKILAIHRLSPSVIIKPWIKLSSAVGIPEIKDFSKNSFPAGHLFVMYYWSRFVSSYSPPVVACSAWVVTLILNLPRLISGSHWMSDLVFTMGYSHIWYCYARYTPLFARAINLIEQLVTLPQRKLSFNN